MLVDSILAFVYLAIIGWVVHQLMGNGNHGTGLLHYAFVGGGGCYVGELLERVTGIYTTGLCSTIGVSIVCAMLVEVGIRRVRHHYLMHMGFDD